MTWNIKTGDCVHLMAQLDENSVDAIVTDPPYGLGFMGKKWDRLPPGADWAEQCLRVLKPGGHVVAFGGSRTVHRLACALEDAGLEIRDSILWLYWSGFPKSMSVDVEGFEGYGTALKPAHEPAVLARKPIDDTVRATVKAWGTGALNVDACRYRHGDQAWPGPQDTLLSNHSDSGAHVATSYRKSKCEPHTTKGQAIGRFPANVYYCPKPSRKERDKGCAHLKGKQGHEATDRQAGSKGLNNPRAGAGRTAANVKNFHPTVKPVRLMSWLCNLVGGQRGSLILDPFCGSGTTGVAAVAQGFDFLGFELSAEYAEIAACRIVDVMPLIDTHDKEFAGRKGQVKR